MRSPSSRLEDALAAWHRESGHERVARWRGDPDARSARDVAEAHAALRGPRVQDAYHEAIERGLLAGDSRAATAAWLREVYAAPGRAKARAAVREALAAPVPYDSDHHRAVDLLLRLGAETRPRQRHAIADASKVTFDAIGRALRSGAAHIEEALEPAGWLADEPAVADRVPDKFASDAQTVLEATEDVWIEVVERVTHAERTSSSHWADLLFALRGARWDDLVPASTRWRRLAERLRPLGLDRVLAKGARAEPRATRERTAVLVLEPGRDVRLSLGVELGLASERDATLAVGRAVAALLAHPGLPAVLGRPLAGTVGRALGALFAHLAADPLFVEHTVGRELSPRRRRPLQELSLALELFELRTDAARVLTRPHASARALSDIAREHLRRAWRTEVLPPELAVVATSDLHGQAHERLRAARWAAPLFVALRARWDEDFWRNPRLAEPVRQACARGASLSVEGWMEELDVDPATLGPRMTEVLG